MLRRAVRGVFGVSLEQRFGSSQDFGHCSMTENIDGASNFPSPAILAVFRSFRLSVPTHVSLDIPGEFVEVLASRVIEVFVGLCSS